MCIFFNLSRLSVDSLEEPMGEKIFMVFLG